MLELVLALDPKTLIAFVVAGLLLNLTPGADFIFVSASGISGGPQIGMAAALGINLGMIIHIGGAAAGVSALLLANPSAYDLIRYAGAAYLVYLAWGAWRSSSDFGDVSAASSVSKAIRRGFMTNVLNPKTMLFIFAFIPQFTDPTLGPVWKQILLLGAIFQIVGLAFSLLLGAAAGYFSTALRSRVRILNKITAIVFGGLAARLLVD
ncbi:MAG: LysE family translocator [Rhodobacteraceae bacterium]|nr:LysE family translocator [Paracoccaceae bacterium]